MHTRNFRRLIEMARGEQWVHGCKMSLSHAKGHVSRATEATLRITVFLLRVEK